MSAVRRSMDGVRPKERQKNDTKGLIEELNSVVGDRPQRIGLHRTSWVNSGDTRPHTTSSKLFRSPTTRAILSLIPWLIGAGLVVSGLLYVSKQGAEIKARIISNAGAAVKNLFDARDNLLLFDFENAQKDLTSARDSFEKAEKSLKPLTPGMIRLFSHLPTLGSLGAGRDLLDAGLLISDAGMAFSDAITIVEKAGILARATSTKELVNEQIFKPLDEAIKRAEQDILDAESIMGGISSDDVSEAYRVQLNYVREQLPEFQALITSARDGLTFLKSALGSDRPRQYLILFANSSELRPAGGFPGSYGLLTVEGGHIKDFQTDDIYNPDGQIKEKIIPPRELQHITKTWGRRDAGWWADFPTSAKKVAELYQRGGGTSIDGVFSIDPEFLSAILKVTGPITLNDYKLTLNSNNVVAELQREIEYAKNNTTGQPKKVIMDLAPIMLEKISQLSEEKLPILAKELMSALKSRSVMMFFSDTKLEKYALSQQFSGSVKETDGDYLNVNIANVKGSKSDAVTDTTMKVESWLEDGNMIHRLTLTRRHDGGFSPYAFYNQTNQSWIRVLVPEGSTLRGISGNADPVLKSLIEGTKTGMQEDADLAKLEETYSTDREKSVTTLKESGKTGFGFWMIIPAGATKSVQLEYAVPAKYVSSNYHLIIQRQSGLRVSNLEFTLQKRFGSNIRSSVPSMTDWPDSWRLTSDFNEDLDLKVTME